MLELSHLKGAFSRADWLSHPGTSPHVAERSRKNAIDLMGLLNTQIT